MGKQNRNENESGAEASAVPEGNGISQEPAPSAVNSDSLPSLPAKPSSSPGIALPNFDLLATLGEAEQFALEVKKFADLIPDPRWQAISKGLDYAIMVHDRLNQGRANS